MTNLASILIFGVVIVAALTILILMGLIGLRAWWIERRNAKLRRILRMERERRGGRL